MVMAEEILKYNLSSTLYSESPPEIKEEYESSVFMDDKVFVCETTISKSNIESMGCVRNNEKENDVISPVSNISSSNVCSYEITGDVKIEKHVNIADDIRIEFNNGFLLCDICQVYYEDYCAGCGMLVHILNDITLSNIDDRSRELPKNILEIQDLFGEYGIYALKCIPKGVKFGPFTGLNASECVWKLKGGKFIVDEANANLLNWMQYIRLARSSTEQNLLVFQCENYLYYRSTCEIQEGEELLVYFGEEYEDSLNQDVEVDFIPAVVQQDKNVYACTFCCLGLSSEGYLRQHKTTCTHETKGEFSIEALMQCPFCEVYLWEKEYSNYHMAYCCLRNTRSNSQLALDNQAVETNAIPAAAASPSHIYKCEHCKYRTKYRGDLKNHNNLHYEVKTHKCGICSKRFKTKRSLKMHVEKIHICDDERKSRKHSKRHNRKVTRSKRGQPVPDESGHFKCATCDFRTKSKYYLKTHTRRRHQKVFKFKCESCEFATNSESRLMVHSKTKHDRRAKLLRYTQDGGKKFKCDQCEFRTRDKYYLKTHVRTSHLKEFNFRCRFCEFRTNLGAHLARHTRTKHLGEYRHKCDACAYQTNHKNLLVRHQKTMHYKVFDFACELCDYKTCQRFNLQRHSLRKHNREVNTSLTCELCSFTTNHKVTLAVHVKTEHLAQFVYKCDKCDYGTNVKSHFEKHMRKKHFKVTTYECDRCDYTATNKLSLRVHVKSKHLNEFSYECMQCEFKANCKTHFVKHIASVHLKVFNFRCDSCDYKTNNRGNLTIHVKSVHLKKCDYACGSCDYRAVTKYDLKRHIKGQHLKQRDFKCDKCEYAAVRRDYLERHVMSKHLQEYKYKCDMCDGCKTNEKRTLTNHIKTKHLKEFSYNCEKCKFKTNRASLLKKHLKVRHHQEFEYSCEKCEWKTHSKRYLERHIRNKHGA